MMTKAFTSDEFDNLIRAIRSIAHGGADAPGGLEYLAMKLAAGDDDLATAVREGSASIAGSLESVAEAMNAIAEAISSKGDSK